MTVLFNFITLSSSFKMGLMMMMMMMMMMLTTTTTTTMMMMMMMLTTTTTTTTMMMMMMMMMMIIISRLSLPLPTAQPETPSRIAPDRTTKAHALFPLPHGHSHLLGGYSFAFR